MGLRRGSCKQRNRNKGLMGMAMGVIHCGIWEGDGVGVSNGEKGKATLSEQQ